MRRVSCWWTHLKFASASQHYVPQDAVVAGGKPERGSCVLGIVEKLRVAQATEVAGNVLSIRFWPVVFASLVGEY